MMKNMIYVCSYLLIWMQSYEKTSERPNFGAANAKKTLLGCLKNQPNVEFYLCFQGESCFV